MELEFSGEIIVVCGKHRENLEGELQKKRGIWEIEVEPCSECLAEAKEEK